jgi:hypothetical protein
MMMPILLIAAAAAAPPGDEAAWETLTTSPVKVECATVAGQPWCRSYGLIHAPIAQVDGALRNMSTSADLFESVLSIDVLAEDTMHIVLDYPAPLDDRDYVAKYTYITQGDTRIFQWSPVVHPGAPETAAAVRLPNFAGEWRLQPSGQNTIVRYTWQAEINGSFPSFAYAQAWKKAGHEALKDLANTQGAVLSRP